MIFKQTRAVRLNLKENIFSNIMQIVTEPSKLRLLNLKMENKALKEHLASAALQMLAEGTDYENLAGTTCRFGYLFQIDGHGLEALFQLVTDKGTAYFAAQGDQLLRLSINEALFEGLTATFLELHA